MNIHDEVNRIVTAADSGPGERDTGWVELPPRASHFRITSEATAEGNTLLVTHHMQFRSRPLPAWRRWVLRLLGGQP